MEQQTSFLRSINGPDDVKRIENGQLDALCAEIRRELILAVSKTGGHLSSNLGVVELTVALLRAFDLEQDDVVWDVGHQCYVYKMLTGRRDAMHTIRTKDGLYGFPNPK